MIVLFSEAAERDLEDIGDWIGQDNLARAVTFVRELQARCLSLGKYPQRFPAVCSIADVPVRKLSHKGYLVLYSVREGEVTIARIIHGSRDWASILEEAE